MNSPSASPDSTPEFSVIVPTCRRIASLTRCLECVDAAVARLDRPCEVIVGDDEPSSTAATALSARFPHVRFIAGPGRGPAANRNHAARAARAPWLVFTDDDCEPQPEWLVGYADGRRAHPEAEVLEGRTSAGAIVGPHQEAPVNEEGGLLWSCNFAIRRDVFERLGGFDELFPFPHLEDVDLRERLLAQRSVIPFVAQAAILHPPRSRRPVAAQVRLYESYFHYARKHGLSLAGSGLSPRSVAISWRERLRAARGAADFLTVAGRALAEGALLAWHLPRWYWKYRKASRSLASLSSHP